MARRQRTCGCARGGGEEEARARMQSMPVLGLGFRVWGLGFRV